MWEGLAGLALAAIVWGVWSIAIGVTEQKRLLEQIAASHQDMRDYLQAIASRVDTLDAAVSEISDYSARRMRESLSDKPDDGSHLF